MYYSKSKKYFERSRNRKTLTHFDSDLLFFTFRTDSKLKGPLYLIEIFKALTFEIGIRNGIRIEVKIGS